MNDIEKLAYLINEDIDDISIDMAKEVRRHLVRNHGLEEYDIHWDTPNRELESYNCRAKSNWDLIDRDIHKSFVIGIRRSIMSRREPNSVLKSIEEFLKHKDWKVSDSKIEDDDFWVKISPK